MSWCEEEIGAKSSSDCLIDSTLADCKNPGRQDDILSRKSRRRMPSMVCRKMSPLPAEKKQALRSKSSVLCSYQTQRERAISQQTETNVDVNHQPQSKELTGGARPKDYKPQERDLKIDENDHSTNFASKLDSEITASFLPRRIKPAQFNASKKSMNRFHQTISKQSDDNGKISVGRPTISAKTRNKPGKVISNPENSNYVSDKKASPSSAGRKDNTSSRPFLYPAINGQKNLSKEKSSLTGKNDKSVASCLFNHHGNGVRNTNARYNSRSRICGNKQTTVSPLTRCKNMSTSSEDLDKLDRESPVFTGVQKIIEDRRLVPQSAPNNGINSSHSTSSYKKSCPNSLVLLDSSDISSSCDESNALDCWSDGEILFPKQTESYSLECVGKSNEMCDDEVISNLHKKLKQICSDEQFDVMADSEFCSFESESDTSLSDSFKLAESYGKNQRRWKSLFSKKFTDDKAKSDSSSNESNESGHTSLVFPTLENSVDVLFRTPIENFNDVDSDQDITDHQKYGNEFGGAIKEELNCNTSRRFLENCEYSSLSEADDEFECDCDVCQTCQFRQQNRGEWLVGEVDVAETNEQNNYVADANFEYGATFSVTSDDPDVNGLWESILSGDAHLETLIQMKVHLVDVRKGISPSKSGSNIPRDRQLPLIWRLNEIFSKRKELMELMLMVDSEFLEHPAAPLITDLDFDRLPSTRIKQSETCEENFCAICLSCYDEDDETKVLPCGHNFHLPCIKVWLNKCGTCPICRDIVLKSSAPS